MLALSASNLILGGLLPLIGVTFSVWVFVESLLSGAVTGAVMIYGLGSIVCGAAVAVFLTVKRSGSGISSTCASSSAI